MSQATLPSFIENPNPEVYLGDDYIIFDFETTNRDKGTALDPLNRSVGAAFSLGPAHPSVLDGSLDTGTVYWDRGGEFDQSRLVRLIGEAGFCVAHNAKFDLAWLERCGVTLSNVIVYDTMLGEYVLGGNRWVYYTLSLEAVAQRRGLGGKTAIVSKMMKAGVCPSEMPESWLAYYAKMDVALTEAIFLRQRKELQERGQLPIAWLRSMLCPVLTDMEKYGMMLDPERVLGYTDDIEMKYADVCAELDEFTGGINLASRDQLVEYLYVTLGFKPRRKQIRGQWVDDLTPKGGYKTDAETISKLKCETTKQEQFLELYARMKGYYNELTKYLRKFADLCLDHDGQVLAQFNQASTQTHRLSSTGRASAIQLHNIQRSYKPMFRARHDGWLMAEADGAQLEFRVAAHLARDEVAIADIVAGADIHSVTAGVIWPGLTPTDGSKHPKRQDAKAHTFKPLYGGMSGTEDEKRYYEFFRKKYKGVTDAQERWKDEAVSTKKQTTEWGLIYYWPNCRMDKSGYITNTTNICNYPVQSFATAEIIPMALLCFWHRLQRSSYQMIVVNTIHDSIVAEVPPEEEQAFHELSQVALIDDVYLLCHKLYGVDLVVPLGAGVKMASHWSEGEEAVYTAKEELWQTK